MRGLLWVLLLGLLTSLPAIGWAAPDASAPSAAKDDEDGDEEEDEPDWDGDEDDGWDDRFEEDGDGGVWDARLERRLLTQAKIHTGIGGGAIALGSLNLLLGALNAGFCDSGFSSNCSVLPVSFGAGSAWTIARALNLGAAAEKRAAVESGDLSRFAVARRLHLQWGFALR